MYVLEDTLSITVTLSGNKPVLLRQSDHGVVFAIVVTSCLVLRSAHIREHLLMAESQDSTVSLMWNDSASYETCSLGCVT